MTVTSPVNDSELLEEEGHEVDQDCDTRISLRIFPFRTGKRLSQVESDIALLVTVIIQI